MVARRASLMAVVLRTGGLKVFPSDRNTEPTLVGNVAHSQRRLPVGVGPDIRIRPRKCRQPLATVSDLPYSSRRTLHTIGTPHRSQRRPSGRIWKPIYKGVIMRRRITVSLAAPALAFA